MVFLIRVFTAVDFSSGGDFSVIKSARDIYARVCIYICMGERKKLTVDLIGSSCGWDYRESEIDVKKEVSECSACDELLMGAL